MRVRLLFHSHRSRPLQLLLVGKPPDGLVVLGEDLGVGDQHLCGDLDELVKLVPVVGGRRGTPLVGRFDIEPFPDFSAK